MYRTKLLAVINIFFALFIFSCDAEFDTLKIVSWSPGSNVTDVSPGSAVEITFSSPVNRTEVEDNFSLKNSDGTVNGNVTWLSPESFRFTPAEPMSRNGRYVISLPRSIRDTDGNTMSSDFISEFYVGSDFTSPSVLSSTPPSGAGAVTGIAVNQSIIVNFSKSMNRGSVEGEFGITPDVPGYFVWSENVPGTADSRVTYMLTSDMEYGKLYTLKISGAAEDSSGNRVGGDYIANFITGSDFTPPSVGAVYDWNAPAVIWGTSTPVHGISRSVSIGVSFTSDMERQSVEKALSITPSAQGIFEWSSDRTVRFIPSKPLSPETKYQVSVETTARGRNSMKLASRYSVEIVTDNPDSLYVKCGGVRGSNHDGDFISLSGTWPLLIDMGSGTPVNRSYYILIEFISSESPVTPAMMNQYSIFDNVLVETFKATSGSEELPASAYIANIEWIGGSTAKIMITGMTNKSSDPSQIPALYRLKIPGGENGILDSAGNYMKEDFIIEFREAIP